MITRIFEVVTKTDPERPGPQNWGKFLVGWPGPEEWAYRSIVDGLPLIAARGWTPQHILVLDLQTGEGAMFRHGGMARADLDKHKIWCCPLFLPFLNWLYSQNLVDLPTLQGLVNLEAEFALYGSFFGEVLAVKITVEAQCRDCGGTGVYCGFFEPKGTAVVCRNCGGSGKEVIRYTPFTIRKIKTGVREVVGLRGRISYQDFLDGKMP